MPGEDVAPKRCTVHLVLYNRASQIIVLEPQESEKVPVLGNDVEIVKHLFDVASEGHFVFPEAS